MSVAGQATATTSPSEAPTGLRAITSMPTSAVEAEDREQERRRA